MNASRHRRRRPRSTGTRAPPTNPQEPWVRARYPPTRPCSAEPTDAYARRRATGPTSATRAGRPQAQLPASGEPRTETTGTLLAPRTMTRTHPRHRRVAKTRQRQDLPRETDGPERKQAAEHPPTARSAPRNRQTERERAAEHPPTEPRSPTHKRTSSAEHPLTAVLLRASRRTPSADEQRNTPDGNTCCTRNRQTERKRAAEHPPMEPRSPTHKQTSSGTSPDENPAARKQTNPAQESNRTSADGERPPTQVGEPKRRRAAEHPSSKSVDQRTTEGSLTHGYRDRRQATPGAGTARATHRATQQPLRSATGFRSEGCFGR